MQFMMGSPRLLRRPLGHFMLTLLLSFLTMAGLPAQAQETAAPRTMELTLGILANEGATRALEAWTPTQALLNGAAEQQQSPYRFRIEPHTNTSLFEELETGGVDVFLGDPAAFVTAEVDYNARAFLSVGHMWEGATYDQTGAVVFARSDSNIRRFQDIRGRRVMGVTAHELTGWKLAQQEFRKYRLEPKEIASDVLFSGGNQREVVYAVQNRLVDVGVIRAGVLESLAQQGVIDLNDFRPIAPLSHEGYPFWVSTPLYPDWVLAAASDVPDDALALMIDTLLRLDVGSPVSQATGGIVWQAPQNYQSVHELLISLRARPYENYLQQAAARIYRAYQWPVLGLLALIFGSLLFLAFQVRRNAQLAEARKNVLQSEARSKQFYRNAIEEHTVFCMLTKDGAISHVNERLLTMLGRSRHALIQHQLSDVLSDTNQENVIKEIMDAMNIGVTWQGALQLEKEDGKVAWVQCTFIPVTGSSDKLSEIAIVASDVTQTRSGVSEKRFNNTLELIQDQVVVLRPSNLEIMYANAAAVQRLITERVGGDWKGRSAADFITEEDLESLRARCQAMAAGPQRRMTWEAEGKSDTTYEISLEYVQPDQDEPRLIAIYRDVSERKVIEKAKREFMATVSHELRTPLTSIKGALGLAKAGVVGEVPDKLSGVINMASNSCDRLVLLVNDILDLEKIESGKMDYQMQLFDLNELVTEALAANKFYAEPLGVSVKNMSDQSAVFMSYGDPSRLIQVMDNLMSNAAKFSDEGSEIRVTVEDVEGRLRISIRDFGEGIPEKAQPTIFDKFTQADSSDIRSKGGTGLGLAIVKLIVEHHQGSISFVSKEGFGTEFFVDLPKVDGEKVVPLPRNSGKIQMPTSFSANSGEVVQHKDAFGHGVMDRLVELTRKAGLEVELEFGRVTAQQIVKGRGVVGQSSAMNWLKKAERNFMDDMLITGDLEDRRVCVVEVVHAADKANSIAKRSIAAGELMQNWFVDCADKVPGEEGLSLISVSQNDEVQGWAREQNIVNIADAKQFATAAEADKTDVVAQFGESNDAATLTIYPMQKGILPQEWPIVILVSRVATSENTRGLVSKFSSGGGGRGRR